MKPLAASMILLALPALADDPGLVLKRTDTRFDQLEYREVRQVSTVISHSRGNQAYTWTGDLNLEKRSRLYFSFAGEGVVTLTIDGKVVLEAEGDLSKAVSERQRLNSGKRRVEVAYRRPGEQIPTRGAKTIPFRMYWQGRDFAREPIPPGVWTHPPHPGLDAHQLKREGHALIRKKRCSNCHFPDPKDERSLATVRGDWMRSRYAPSLEGIGERLTGAWMAKWIAAPQAMRPGSSMPDLPLQPKDIADIAAFLSDGKPSPPVHADPAGARQGGALFHRLGCIGCHGLGRQGTPAFIGLGGVGHKFRKGALKAFLLEPRKHYRGTQMPDFRLSGEEAGMLAHFLRSLEDPYEGGISGDRARGGELVKSSACYACHPPLPAHQGAQYAPRFNPALKGQDLAGTGCIAKKPQPGIPHFTASAEDRAAIAATLPGDPGFIRERQDFITRLRCNACHDMHGREALLSTRHKLTAHLAPAPEPDDEDGAPKHLGRVPDLTHAGEKLNPAWMRKLFKGELGYRGRPWLDQRMPAFPGHADALARQLAFQSGYPILPHPEPPAIDGDAALGKQLTGLQGGFVCINCHGIGSQKPLAVFEGQGVNLKYSAERMRHEFYHRWMLNPQRIDAMSIMPRYVDDEGVSTLTDVHGGDARKQFDDIWAFMRSLLK